jgi:predicted ATP-dependent endonuclease of OLD family
MKIQSFKFSDNKQKLQIEEINFDDLNLLVGASGVGKTRILDALDLICDVAKGRGSKLDNLEWSISFSHLGQKYKWELKSSASVEDVLSETGQSEIVFEKLIQYEGDVETEIFYRDSLESKLNNQQLPKLKKTESVITLLSEEELISSVCQGFRRLVFMSEIPQKMMIAMGIDPVSISSLLRSDSTMNFEEFKEKIADAPTVLKALLLQSIFPDSFDEIKQSYTDIFPIVKNVRVTTNKGDQGLHELFFEIEEFGLENWIPQQRLSSGMLRTLIYLFEISLATEESVIVIDEFENSLGINCMSELTNFILDKSPVLQFVMTSHHPYIINNIPWTTWQIVSRSGGYIHVTKAIDIQALKTASSLDKFTQLIDFLECEASPE